MMLGCQYDITHARVPGRRGPLRRVELLRVLGHVLADGARHRQPDVGVDVDLAHAVLDGLLDLLDGHAVGFLHRAAVLADDGQQLLRHAGRAVHHQVRVRDAAVDLLDAVDRQDVTGGLAGELVGAVAGADGDRQRVELRLPDEVGGLLRVGQQLLARHRRLGAVAVLLVAAHGLQRAQAAELALDGDAQRVRHVDHLAGDVDVVVVAGDGLAVGLQAAVHHHRAEAEVDRALAHRRALAVVLVHDQRHLGPGLERGLDQVLDEGLAGVLAGAGAGLQDDRRADLGGGGHDRLHLLQVVDVEGRDAVAVFGGVVQQLAHRDEGHGDSDRGKEGWMAARRGPGSRR